MLFNGVHAAIVDRQSCLRAETLRVDYNNAMITIFNARNNLDSHQQFQLWRQAHWRDGEFLNCSIKAGRKEFTLHSARCSHYGTAPSTRSFTKVPKVCSMNRSELFEWAIAQGAYIVGCNCM